MDLPKLVMEGFDSLQIINIISNGDPDQTTYIEDQTNVLDDILQTNPENAQLEFNAAVDILANEDTGLISDKDRESIAIQTAYQNERDLGGLISSASGVPKSIIDKGVADLTNDTAGIREAVKDLSYSEPISNDNNKGFLDIFKYRPFEGMPDLYSSGIAALFRKDSTPESDIAEYQNIASEALAELNTLSGNPPGVASDEVLAGSTPGQVEGDAEISIEGMTPLTTDEIGKRGLSSTGGQYITNFNIPDGTGELWNFNNDLYGIVQRPNTSTQIYFIGKNEAQSQGAVQVGNQSWDQAYTGAYLPTDIGANIPPIDPGSVLFGDDRNTAKNMWSAVRVDQMGPKAEIPQFYNARDMGFAGKWGNYQLTSPIRGDLGFASFMKNNDVTDDQRSKGWDNLISATQAINNMEEIYDQPPDIGQYYSKLADVGNQKQYLIDVTMAAADINPDTITGKQVSSLLGNRWDLEYNKSLASGTGGLGTAASFVDFVKNNFGMQDDKKVQDADRGLVDTQMHLRY